MQLVSADFLSALQGSFVGTVSVDAWYDGNLVYDNLPLTGGSVTIDSTRTIAGSADLSFGAPGADLLPRKDSDPLAASGSILNVRAGIQIPGRGTEDVSLGWFRIDQSRPAESPAWYRDKSGRVRWITRGVQVQCTCSDLWSYIDRFPLLSQQPASLASVINEITRLATDATVQVADLTGVTDQAIPRSLVYDQSRSTTIQNLAGLLGCVARMSPGGALELVPAAPSGPAVWTLTVDPDQAANVASWAWTWDNSSLYNAVVSTGTTAAGTPLQATAVQDQGPLRWGGPHGCVPYQRQAPLATSQNAIIADAQTRLRSLISDRVLYLPITCVSNPALQTGDMVTVELPYATYTVPVVSIVWPLPPSTMTVTVAIPRAQVTG